MGNRTQLTLNLQSSLNRAIVYTAFPMGKAINFIIYHHKKTSAIQFDVDSRSYPIKNNDVTINMYRNLENCKFTKTFFKLENLSTDSYDYQYKFGGIYRSYEKHCFPFCKEKMDLQAGNSNDPSTNYLLILGWKLFDIEDDLIFYFVQRRCYNNITRSNIIRTAGLQFATKRGLDSLDKYVNNSNEIIRKIDKIPDLFNEDVKPKNVSNSITNTQPNISAV